MITKEASDIIEDSLSLYGKDIISNHFPSYVDGLKIGQRRLLISQPLNNSFRGIAMIANTLPLHPYGDTSVYDTGARLAQCFRHSYPLLSCDDNIGNYAGDKHGAARYNHYSISQFGKDILFNGLNLKSIPHRMSEDCQGTEISYFIPKIPLTLLLGSESIGFGYNSKILPLSLESTAKLAIDFVKCKDKTQWDYSRLASSMIPTFPYDIHIKNSNDLIAAYKKGDFNHPVESEGIYKIINPTTILIRSISYGVSPRTIKDKLIGIMCDKKSINKTGFEFKLDVVTEDKMYFDIMLSVKRGTNLFDFIEFIRSVTSIRSMVHPQTNYVTENDTIINMNIVGLLNVWYEKRYKHMFANKKLRQQELQRDKMNTLAQLAIVEDPDEVIRIVRQDKNQDSIIQDLRKRFNLTINQCLFILASKIETLLKAKTSEISQRYERIVKELDTISNSFTEINQEIINDINIIRKKHTPCLTPCSSIHEFIGCLIIKDYGIIQISDITELSNYCDIFKSHKLHYVEYPSEISQLKFNKTHTKYSYISNIPFTSNSSAIQVIFKDYPYTFIRSEGKSNARISPSIDLNNEFTCINFINKKSKIIMTNGSILDATADIFNTRKSASDVLYAFNHQGDINNCVIVSYNKRKPDILRFRKIEDGKTVLPSSSSCEIFAIFDLENEASSNVINIPFANPLIASDIRSLIKNKINDIPIKKIK